MVVSDIVGITKRVCGQKVGAWKGETNVFEGRKNKSGATQARMDSDF
jgi:hypothetical protein